MLSFATEASVEDMSFAGGFRRDDRYSVGNVLRNPEVVNEVTPFGIDASASNSRNIELSVPFIVILRSVKGLVPIIRLFCENRKKMVDECKLVAYPSL